MPANAGISESAWTTVNGLKIHSRVALRPDPGGPAPIVLVHGFGVSGSYMAPAAARLAPFASVYAPDLPGSGRSDAPAQALSISALADFLAD